MTLGPFSHSLQTHLKLFTLHSILGGRKCMSPLSTLLLFALLAPLYSTNPPYPAIAPPVYKLCIPIS